jgi:hypothetical protein
MQKHLVVCAIKLFASVIYFIAEPSSVLVASEIADSIWTQVVKEMGVNFGRL